MTPATDTQVWQYAGVAMAVAASAIAFACHLSPALRAWLRNLAGRLLRHRHLPAPVRKLGSRLAAQSTDADCVQGCGPCGGCGAHASPRGPQSTIAPPRSRRHV
ncbi:DUF6587 family protein [Achromobacter sp. DH1f]|uniref:DUF6587 family protein n=1 Tax=Achromobacter sp. DH1f TaxID=1397275 RepID=UPI00046A8DB3|nr:DUF6587 family protein [Achromobacter sp. DH1f]